MFFHDHFSLPFLTGNRACIWSSQVLYIAVCYKSSWYIRQARFLILPQLTSLAAWKALKRVKTGAEKMLWLCWEFFLQSLCFFNDHFRLKVLISKSDFFFFSISGCSCDWQEFSRRSQNPAGQVNPLMSLSSYAVRLCSNEAPLIETKRWKSLIGLALSTRSWHENPPCPFPLEELNPCSSGKAFGNVWDIGIAVPRLLPLYFLWKNVVSSK